MATGIKYEGRDIKIDVDYLLEAMSDEDSRLFIKQFAVQSHIIGHVVDYICGDDPDGWWTGDAGNIRMKILQRIEAKQIEDGPRYNWEVWRQVVDKLRDIHSTKQIYWQLYHGESYEIFTREDGTRVSFNELVYDWMKRNGIKSNYSTKEADEDIKKLTDMVHEALVDMRERLCGL